MKDILCDLVLLSWNNLSETQNCLKSLFECTDLPCRLILVDNGSEPEVREALKKVEPKGAIREVMFIQNDKNLGFPKGMNCGLRASSAPFVCLLNNDLRFTVGWLKELVEVISHNPMIGLINPFSNTLGGHRPRGMSLEKYASTLHKHRGTYMEVGMCSGFCLLISRELINQIGLLSEEIERCFFEDEDYSMRAQQAHFQCAVALGSYVYHAEHRSVRLVPEREALFSRNRSWCYERWGRWVRIAWPHPSKAVLGSPELKKWLERLVSMAKRRSHIHVYSPLPSGATKDMLFRSVGLIPHTGIWWHDVPEQLASFSSVFSVLKRQKKRFDIIVAPNAVMERFFSFFQWIHFADIVPASEEERLLALWQKKRFALDS